MTILKRQSVSHGRSLGAPSPVMPRTSIHDDWARPIPTSGFLLLVHHTTTLRLSLPLRLLKAGCLPETRFENTMSGKAYLAL